ICKVIKIHEELSCNKDLDNKLIYECLLWAFTILLKENVNDTECVDKNFINTLKKHYAENIEKYSLLEYHYYANILTRFNDTANLFSKMFNVDFSLYIKDERFNNRLKGLKQTEDQGLLKIEALQGLRVLKPEPSSIPIEEIINDLNTSKYLVRPSYQRQEKINTRKASSIIESILLGIYLPPIFVFKNKDSVKEVIDGQQRLLSILGFMGKTYKDEKGESQYSKNNNFSLNNLRILKEFNGRKFSSLPENYIEKLYDFDINIIEIDAKVNDNFDPIDLFIRLNNKPYPIKDNSFEMWNSTVNYSIIKEIKTLTNNHLKWFYLRVTNIERINDRMENEEMISVLAYLQYIKKHDEKTSGVEFYLKQDRLSCRISNKSAITNFLQGLDEDLNKKTLFSYCIEDIDTFIRKLRHVLVSGVDEMEDADLSNELNDLINIKKSSGFKRTLQDIYLLWMVLSEIELGAVIINHESIKEDLLSLIKKMKNVTNEKVDEGFLKGFTGDIKRVINKYQG
ncbi:DUF262 domain-containing protein, partial [Yersinia enterocolitica]|nr:DUF262 domain-containing protein [Yersinia enterocolitica]